MSLILRPGTERPCYAGQSIFAVFMPHEKRSEKGRVFRAPGLFPATQSALLGSAPGNRPPLLGALRAGDVGARSCACERSCHPLQRAATSPGRGAWRERPCGQPARAPPAAAFASSDRLHGMLQCRSRTRCKISACGLTKIFQYSNDLNYDRSLSLCRICGRDDGSRRSSIPQPNR